MSASEWIAWLNVAGASVAFVLQCCAARNGAIRARWLHAAIAAVAVVYVAGYVWLATILHRGGDIAHWSAVFRGVSPVAWIVVWWAPALLSIRRHQEDETVGEVLRRASEVEP